MNVNFRQRAAGPAHRIERHARRASRKAERTAREGWFRTRLAAMQAKSEAKASAPRRGTPRKTIGAAAGAAAAVGAAGGYFLAKLRGSHAEGEVAEMKRPVSKQTEGKTESGNGEVKPTGDTKPTVGTPAIS